MTTPNTPDDPNTHMPLIAHLVELRKRVMYALLLMLVIFGGLAYFSNQIYEFVSQPIRDQLPAGTSMIATDITSTFFAPIKLTMVVAFFLSMPMVLHQIWKFVSPGLYAHEKKFAIPLLFISVILFYGGVAFAHYLIFPVMMKFFVMTSPENVALAPDISSYLSIALKLFFAFGFAFEIPVFTMLLIWSGISSVEDLRQKRPYVIVFCFVFGAIFTPPDPLSQIMLAVPMCLLFEFGLLMGRMLSRQSAEARKNAEEKEKRESNLPVGK